MKTAAPFTYFAAPNPARIAVIPAGTSVRLAKNLPPREDGAKQYWCNGWRGMDKQARSWKRNCGFLLTEHEVKNNQKVVLV
jgi:hypothetical protein